MKFEIEITDGKKALEFMQVLRNTSNDEAHAIADKIQTQFVLLFEGKTSEQIDAIDKLTKHLSAVDEPDRQLHQEFDHKWQGQMAILHGDRASAEKYLQERALEVERKKLEGKLLELEIINNLSQSTKMLDLALKPNNDANQPQQIGSLGGLPDGALDPKTLTLFRVLSENPSENQSIVQVGPDGSTEQSQTVEPVEGVLVYNTVERRAHMVPDTKWDGRATTKKSTSNDRWADLCGDATVVEQRIAKCDLEKIEPAQGDNLPRNPDFWEAVQKSATVPEEYTVGNVLSVIFDVNGSTSVPTTPKDTNVSEK